MGLFGILKVQGSRSSSEMRFCSEDLFGGVQWILPRDISRVWRTTSLGCSIVMLHRRRGLPSSIYSSTPPPPFKVPRVCSSASPASESWGRPMCWERHWRLGTRLCVTTVPCHAGVRHSFWAVSLPITGRKTCTSPTLLQAYLQLKGKGR